MAVVGGDAPSLGWPSTRRLARWSPVAVRSCGFNAQAVIGKSLAPRPARSCGLVDLAAGSRYPCSTTTGSPSSARDRVPAPSACPRGEPLIYPWQRSRSRAKVSAATPAEEIRTVRIKPTATDRCAFDQPALLGLALRRLDGELSRSTEGAGGGWGGFVYPTGRTVRGLFVPSTRLGRLSILRLARGRSWGAASRLPTSCPRPWLNFGTYSVRLAVEGRTDK